MKGRWLLLTFGAGLPNWRAAAHRVGRQARDSSWFHDVRVYDERILKREFPAFTASHSRALRSSIRGFGWWIWKPFLIRESLRTCLAQDLDGVVYVDAGSEINGRTAQAEARFQVYLDMAMDGRDVFAMHLPGHAEEIWTRKEVMDRFELTADLRTAPQIQAQPIMVANPQAIEFADEWLHACTQDEYFLVKDASVGEASGANFREHRHDQSVFSSLMKSHSIATIPDETFWAPDWQVQGAGFPLWAARNRTRVSVADTGLIDRGIRFAELAYSRGHRELATRLRGARS